MSEAGCHGVGSGRPLSLACVGAFALGPLVAFSLSAAEGALVSPSYRDTSLLGQGPIHDLLSSLEALSPNAVMVGAGLQHWRGHRSVRDSWHAAG